MSTIEQRSRFSKIPGAVARSGISRASLYKLAPKHPGLLVKHGRATLCNLEILDRILDALPVAEIKAASPPHKPSAAP
jgi:hypothetical protein